nr:hypothetical protein CFP56_32472 [Quercus suber]
MIMKRAWRHGGRGCHPELPSLCHWIKSCLAFRLTGSSAESESSCLSNPASEHQGERVIESANVSILSNENARSNNKKTIAPADVIAALKDAELESFLPRLEAELKKYNDIQCEKRNTYRRKVKEEKAGTSAVAAENPVSADQEPMAHVQSAKVVANGHVDDAARPAKKLRMESGGAVIPNGHGRHEICCMTNFCPGEQQQRRRRLWRFSWHNMPVWKSGSWNESYAGSSNTPRTAVKAVATDPVPATSESRHYIAHTHKTQAEEDSCARSPTYLYRYEVFADAPEARVSLPQFCCRKPVCLPRKSPERNHAWNATLPNEQSWTK